MSKLAVFLSVLAIILALASSIYFYIQNQKGQADLQKFKLELSDLSQKTQENKPKLIQQETSSSSAATMSAQIRVGLRNGTKKVGLTGKYELDVKKYLKEAIITSKDNASKNDYDRTIVVVINENQREKAKNLAKDLKANLESLPAGEEKPDNTDILIIFGKDKS